MQDLASWQDQKQGCKTVDGVPSLKVAVTILIYQFRIRCKTVDGVPSLKVSDICRAVYVLSVLFFARSMLANIMLANQ